MLKRIAPVVGAAILAFAALDGCTDSPSSPASPQAAGADRVEKIATPSTTTLSVGDAKPSGVGMFMPKPYEKWLRELRLTDAQAASARNCLAHYRDCLKDAESAFNNARAEILARQERALREVRQLVERGTITADQARARIKEINERTKAALKEAETQAKTHVRDCEERFEHCIREFLTREQIAKWEKIAARGKK
jgi:polyhydroxyalkanoate synthesis regulator phasin